MPTYTNATPFTRTLDRFDYHVEVLLTNVKSQNEKRSKDFVIKVGVCKKDEREASFAAGG